MAGTMRAAFPLGLAVAMAAFAPSAGLAQDLDLDAVFRCNGETEVDPAHCVEQRGVIIANCTVCHTFAPIVMQQWAKEEWHALLFRHVENDRVGQLSEADVEALNAYLAATFNPDRPPPELPPALLETWTNY